MLRVGIINYINSLPFVAPIELGLEHPDVRIERGVPSQLNQQLREGELDVSFISTAEYLCYPELYHVLPSLCIGACERVASVCLYVRNSIQELDDRPVAITAESASSAMMLRLFCHRYWKISPRFVTVTSPDQLQDFEGVLLVGDACLSRPQILGFQTIDLATVWYYATGLPFTFAVLAARRHVMETSEAAVEKWHRTLKANLAWSRLNIERVEELAAKRSPLPLSTIREYYQLLRYDFNEPHQRAVARFGQLLEETDAHVLIS